MAERILVQVRERDLLREDKLAWRERRKDGMGKGWAE